MQEPSAAETRGDTLHAKGNSSKPTEGPFYQPLSLRKSNLQHSVPSLLLQGPPGGPPYLQGGPRVPLEMRVAGVSPI